MTSDTTFFRHRLGRFDADLRPCRFRCQGRQDVIGGYVEKNTNNPDPRLHWNNTCAVRMSYILNQSGLMIPGVAGQMVSGAGGRQYFFRVKSLIELLKQRRGSPEVVKYPPSGGGTLAGRTDRANFWGLP